MSSPSPSPRRARRGKRRQESSADGPGLGSLELCVFTCPRVVAEAAEGAAPAKHHRISRAARRRLRQRALQRDAAAAEPPSDCAAEADAELVSLSSGTAADLAQRPSPAAGLPRAGEETPQSAALAPVWASPRASRRASPAPSRSAPPAPSDTADDCSQGAAGATDAAEGARGHRKHKQHKEKRAGDTRRARSCFGDELLDIDHMIQFFLLDRDMPSVRLMLADRHERKVLQDVAREYKVTMRCGGTGDLRVVHLMKTKNSGHSVDARRLRSLLGTENALHEPAELFRSCSRSSPDCSPAGYTSADGLRSPPSVYRAASRMTRAQQLEQPPDPHVFELYYQRYKDGTPFNSLLQSAKVRHDAMVAHSTTGGTRQNATEAPAETMFERLMRAEAWLALQRQNKHQIAARRRAVADASSVGSTPGLTAHSSGRTTPSEPATSRSPTPIPDPAVPALDLGPSLSTGLTGTLDGLRERLLRPRGRRTPQVEATE
eukprot:TRINITY_DN14775_c0_g1_i1.p1 TRINITY_DN14775_c0_g1~~TRINITY_DN14775_c0_g1_i1.p1  ORF type:complete len:490 (+),score=143.64 TRINITY_DN14775_c0_g1_i1:79-1548(+)